jgi:hypothetical protein
VGVYIALGRFADARRIADGLPSDGRAEFIGRVLFNAATAGQPGAKEALAAHLTRAYPNLADAPAVPLWVDALALTGKLDELRMMVDRATRDGYVYFPNGGGNGRFTWMVPVAEAKLALAEGRVEDAQRYFDRSVEMGGGDPSHSCLATQANTRVREPHLRPRYAGTSRFFVIFRCSNDQSGQTRQQVSRGAGRLGRRG